MKQYVLIYAYTNFLKDEVEFWNKLSTYFKAQNYNLIIIAPHPPKFKHDFLYSRFTEKLDKVETSANVSNDNKDKDYYISYIEREEIWYGKSDTDRLSAARSQRLKYSMILDEANPALVVIANGQHAGELILKDEIISRNIPFLFFERGCLPKTWHIDKLGVTAGTEVAAKNITEIEDLGTSKYDKYQNYYLEQKYTWWHQPNSDDELNLRKKYNIRDEQKIVFFANQLDNDTSNFLYSPFFDDNISAFTWLINQLKAKECYVIVKSHPWYSGPRDVFTKALKENNIDGVWLEDVSLFDCLKQADLVCAVNSTIVYEALMYKKPTLQLGLSILSNKEILYELKNKDDKKTIEDWFNNEDFQTRHQRYSTFMNYMIEKELCFFSKKCLSMNFNGAEFFYNKVIGELDEERYGKENLSFIETVKIKSKYESLKGQLKRAIKKAIS